MFYLANAEKNMIIVEVSHYSFDRMDLIKGLILRNE